MSKHEEFMRRAIALSRRCMIDNGSAPFAALIVKDGVVVGEGVNNVVNSCDPTSHGEIEAIRDAARRLGRWDLSGCDLIRHASRLSSASQPCSGPRFPAYTTQTRWQTTKTSAST